MILTTADIISVVVKNNPSITTYLALADDYYDSLVDEMDIDRDYLSETVSSKIKRVLVMYVQYNVALDNIGQTSVQQAQGVVDPWLERKNAWWEAMNKLKELLVPSDFYDSSNLPDYLGNVSIVGTWERG